MAIFASCRWLDLLLNKAKDAIDISYEDFAINDGGHATDAEEALPTVLVVWLPDVVDDACDCILEQVSVAREHLLYILVHNWNELNAFLFDEGIASVLIEGHYFSHNRRSLILRR